MKPLRNLFHILNVNIERLTKFIALIDKEDDEALFAIAEELGKVW